MQCKLIKDNEVFHKELLMPLSECEVTVWCLVDSQLLWVHESLETVILQLLGRRTPVAECDLMKDLQWKVILLVVLSKVISNQDGCQIFTIKFRVDRKGHFWCKSVWQGLGDDVPLYILGALITQAG